MNKIKYFFKRIDTIERITIVVSIALFLILPSLLLINVFDISSDTKNIIYPSLVSLFITLGGSLVCFCFPIKVSPVYFLLQYLTHLFLFITIDSSIVNVSIKLCKAITTINIIYSLISFIFTLTVLLIYVSMKIKRDRNKDVDGDDKSSEIVNFINNDKKLMSLFNPILPKNEIVKGKNIKLSLIFRIASYILYFVVSIIYVASPNAISLFKSDYLSEILTLSLLLMLILLLTSVYYKKEIKYLYFYIAVGFNVFLLIALKEKQLPLIGYIIALIVSCLGFFYSIFMDSKA